MKNKATCLLPLALLIMFHGSLTAQKSSDAREWRTANFPKTFNVKYHGRWFATSLPEESVATYVW